MLDPNKTIKFSIKDEHDEEMRQTLLAVYNALKERGYNPEIQIVGYLITNDPAYISSYKGARTLIQTVDRDEVLKELVSSYLTQNE